MGMGMGVGTVQEAQEPSVEGQRSAGAAESEVPKESQKKLRQKATRRQRGTRTERGHKPQKWPPSPHFSVSPAPTPRAHPLAGKRARRQDRGARWRGCHEPSPTPGVHVWSGFRSPDP